MVPSLKYVLITPARNEAEFIEQTIKCVVAQTVRPLKWVIVSDGSTDGTDDIVRKYAAQHDWIELVRMPERKERNFAGKVHAFNAGYGLIQKAEYDLVGCMDADISFDSEYFSFLIRKFVENPMLGLAGTPFQECGVNYDYRFTSIEHVSGACQLFRRECFDEIGGYAPIKAGGIDLVAALTARMRGWETRTFLDKQYEHHRPMGTAALGKWRSKFRLGQKDYLLGNSPLWEVFRSFYQMSREPFIVGGSAIILGYVWALLRRAQSPVSPDFIRYLRREQMKRLRAFFIRRRRTSEAGAVHKI